jgi:hypothetical protein
MKRKKSFALTLVAAALFVATVPAKAADWRISTSYSGTTRYSPVITTNPTHLFGNSYYYTTPLGSAPLPSSLLGGAGEASFGLGGSTSNSILPTLGFSTISDSVWGNAEQSASYAVTFTIRWIGTAAPPSVQKFWFTDAAQIEKKNLPGWTDGISRTTLTVYDATSSLTLMPIVGTGTCTARFGVGDPASHFRMSQTDIAVNITGGYGRFQCKVDDYLRYQFGNPATVGTGKSVTCSAILLATPGTTTP